MNYARKLVYHYSNGQKFTLKLGDRLLFATITSELPYLVTINDAESVEYHTDWGEVWHSDKISLTKVRRKKPHRTTNPNSKTKMQKRKEFVWGVNFKNELLTEIAKESEQSNYHFWLGANV